MNHAETGSLIESTLDVMSLIGYRRQ